jgi:hypothetical protein
MKKTCKHIHKDIETLWLTREELDFESNAYIKHVSVNV